MNCIACKTEFQDLANCPVCGFPNYRVTQMTEEAEKQLEVMAAAHRKKRLGQTNIGVLAYAYTKADGSEALEYVEERNLLLANGADLMPDEIKWTEPEFGRPTDREKITFKVYLQQAGGEAVWHDIEMDTPKLEDHWHVGIKLTVGLDVCLTLGNSKVYTESRPLHILPQV